MVRSIDGCHGNVSDCDGRPTEFHPARDSPARCPRRPESGSANCRSYRADEGDGEYNIRSIAGATSFNIAEIEVFAV